MSRFLSTYTLIGCIAGFDNPRGPDRAVTGPCSGRSLYRHDTGVLQVAKCPPVNFIQYNNSDITSNCCTLF